MRPKPEALLTTPGKTSWSSKRSMTKTEKLPLPIRPGSLFYSKMMLSAARCRCIFGPVTVVQNLSLFSYTETRLATINATASLSTRLYLTEMTMIK